MRTRKELHPADRVLVMLHAMLYPEQYPPGHEFHDPEHVYWDGINHHTKQQLRDMSDDDLVDALYEANAEGELSWDTESEEPLAPGLRDNMIEAILSAQREELEDLEPFQWSSDTIEWVAQDITRNLPADYKMDH